MTSMETPLLKRSDTKKIINKGDKNWKIWWRKATPSSKMRCVRNYTWRYDDVWNSGWRFMACQPAFADNVSCSFLYLTSFFSFLLQKVNPALLRIQHFLVIIAVNIMSRKYSSSGLVQTPDPHISSIHGLAWWDNGFLLLEFTNIFHCLYPCLQLHYSTWHRFHRFFGFGWGNFTCPQPLPTNGGHIARTGVKIGYKSSGLRLNVGLTNWVTGLPKSDLVG